MRESFIAQYLEEQKRFRTESVQKSVSHKKKVNDWRKKTVPKKVEVKRTEKPGRPKRKKAHSGRLHDIVKALLGKAKITKRTLWRDGLKMLGFSSYQQYLKSPLWQAVKCKVFAVNGKECLLCNNPASTVHHRKYTALTLIGEQLNYLSPICNSCHKMIEFDTDGSKLASDDVEEYVAEHLRQNEVRFDEVSQEFRDMFKLF